MCDVKIFLLSIVEPKRLVNEALLCNIIGVLNLDGLIFNLRDEMDNLN
jgi:hypothetical protein